MEVFTSPRTRILNTADQLFYQRGLHAVGIDEIVARSKVAKTTLYAHFHSKDLLITAYLRRRSDEWRTFLEAELGAFTGDAAAKIELIFTFLAEGCADPDFRGCPFINVAAEFADPSHPARAVCLDHRRWLRDLFTDLTINGGAPEPRDVAGQLCLLYDAAMIGAQFDPVGDDAVRARATARLIVNSAFQPAR